LEFFTAERIIFERDAVTRLGELAKAYGKRGCYLHGRQEDQIQSIRKILLENGLEICDFQIHGEPTIVDVKELVNKCKAYKVDFVISVGGGSVIDTGKTISMMLTNPGDLEDYLEVVGQALPIKFRSAPFIAVPTTAGTGSEVTKNAVLSVPEKKIKVSLRGSLILARIALIDPELTLSLPKETTASTGMDALTQLIEPFLSIKANPMVDLFCRDGIARVIRSLSSAYKNGGDIYAREDMCWASLYGGIALANAGLGAVHGFAAPIGGMFDAPHGAVCAILLPKVMLVNYKAMKKRGLDTSKFLELSNIVTGNGQGNMEECIDIIQSLCEDLHIPRLRAYGITEKDLPIIIGKAKISSSMKGNPLQLDEEDLTEILINSL